MTFSKKNVQSSWLNFANKKSIEDGSLKKLIDRGISGLNFFLSLFYQDLISMDCYDNDIRRLSQTSASPFEIYEEIIIKDVSKSADLLLPVYGQTNGLDGYVNVEINPKFANNLEETLKEGKRLIEKVGRPNVMLKVPATDECFEAIEEFTAMGINVNAYLIYSIEQYEKTALSYIKGINRAKKNGLDTSKIYSVASVSVSEIDEAIDPLVGDSDYDDDLKGCASFANAINIYGRFKEIFKYFHSGNDQRILWTSIKSENETKYVEELFCKNTICSMSETAFKYYSSPNFKGEIKYNQSQANEIIRKFDDAEISIDAVCDKILKDKIVEIQGDFDKILKAIEEKSSSLRENIIAIASDHAGYLMKSYVADYLVKNGYKINDLGTSSADISVDYPDFGEAAANEVASGRARRGIVVCGSGIGISIAANKVNGIRAALVHDKESAIMSRRHNNSNMIALSGRPYTQERAKNAEEIVKAWLETEFDGGRHQMRIDKIAEIEKRQSK